MMLPLCIRVTLSRPFSSAYWIALRTRRLEPNPDTGLMPMPESSRMREPNSSARKRISFFASAEPLFHSMPA